MADFSDDKSDVLSGMLNFGSTDEVEDDVVDDVDDGQDETEGSGGLVCPKCGSHDVNVQIVEVGQRSARKGAGAVGNANNAARKVTAGMTLGMSNMFWKRSKGTVRTKTVNKTMAVCQSCGNSWEVGKSGGHGCAIAIAVLLAIGMVGSCVSGGKNGANTNAERTAQTVTSTSTESAQVDDVTSAVVRLSDVSATAEGGYAGKSVIVTVTGAITNGTDDDVYTSDMPSIVTVGRGSAHLEIEGEDTKYRYLREGASGTFTWEVTFYDAAETGWSFGESKLAVDGLDDVKVAMDEALSKHAQEAEAEAAAKEAERAEEEARRAEEEAAREAEEEAHPKSAEELLDERLDVAACWTAIEQYASEQYPYGFDPHWVLGKIAERAEDEDTWFLKYEVTITNAFGASYDTTFEAYVSGTTESPVVDSLIVY